jgi:mono/diheme cytochrome c family protein
VRALHRGISRNGENLYPAFPYVAYALLSADDVLAIRSYLATLPPVRAATPANDLAFPFNQRYLMRAWNLLFLPSYRFQPDPSRDETWNRGAYLVNALGHCGECHTPRTFMMGLNDRKQLAGAEQAGWLAYNLTNDHTNAWAVGAMRIWKSIFRPVTPRGTARPRVRWRKWWRTASAI